MDTNFNGCHYFWVILDVFMFSFSKWKTVQNVVFVTYLSHLMTKPTKCSVRGCTGWSESSLCAQWVAKDPSFLHAAESEDSDPERMPRLICVFAGRTCHFVGFVMRRLISYKKNLKRPILPMWYLIVALPEDLVIVFYIMCEAALGE